MTVKNLLHQFYRLGCLAGFLCGAGTGHSQVYGCKDPTAQNYSALATIDNGSCHYQKKVYTPPVRVNPISVVLEETSGLQWAANHLWTINDGGSSPTLFRIDTTNRDTLQIVNLDGVTNVDWEDLAFDGTHFYIGDFGNNTGDRTDLKIYKFPLSAIPAYPGNLTVAISSSAIDVISFTYSDQVQPPVSPGMNQTQFDCEAMFVDNGKIHLFTKNWVDKTSTHYVINSIAAGTYVAAAMETIATNYLVSAADKAPGSDSVILLGYQNSGFGDHFLTLLSGFSAGSYFNGTTRLIDLPTAAEMGQAEGITFRNSNDGYISNEKFSRSAGLFSINVDQKLRTFYTALFPTNIVLPVSLQQFALTPLEGLQQIHWRFSQPVKALKIQHSQNSSDFATIQDYSSSENGSFQHRPPSGTTYYRLSWKEANGTDRVSNILRAEKDRRNQVAKVELSANGLLQFVNNGIEAADFWARLLSADGRVVAQSARFKVVPGVNKVSFARQLNRNTILLLQLVNGREAITKKLTVE